MLRYHGVNSVEPAQAVFNESSQLLALYIIQKKMTVKCFGMLSVAKCHKKSFSLERLRPGTGSQVLQSCEIDEDHTFTGSEFLFLVNSYL